MITIITTVEEVDETTGAVEIKSTGDGLATPNEAGVSNMIREAIKAVANAMAMHGPAGHKESGNIGNQN